MGFIIGNNSGYSTWGKCRTPVFNKLEGMPGFFSHNNVASDGFAPANGGYFRCANWKYYQTDESGNPNFIGPFAYALGAGGGVGYTFRIGAFGIDPNDMTLSPNLLDDLEIQQSWVGRGAVLNTGTISMAYVALDGLANSGQSVPTGSVTVDSLDL
jgi:hypothetical protein